MLREDSVCMEYAAERLILVDGKGCEEDVCVEEISAT
jgi:hypothetical protein